MTHLPIDPQYVVKDEAALRSMFQETHALAIQKSLTYLDEHSRNFIARSPFICLGTQNLAGGADVSPRGDPEGFVKIIDDKTIAIPDRPGNNRLDSLVNILSNPSVGVLFLVPRFDDTLRINGNAKLTTEPDILQSMIVKDRVPKLAIIITLSEVFMHCAKAFRRSQLWNPDHFQDRSEMPSLVKIVLDQTTGAPEDDDNLKEIDAALEDEYKNTMY